MESSTFRFQPCSRAVTAMAMASIAHPDFREELLKYAHEHF